MFVIRERIYAHPVYRQIVHKILEGNGGNMTDRGELKDSDADLSRCLFVHHKCRVTANSGLASDQPATNRSTYGADRRPN